MIIFQGTEVFDLRFKQYWRRHAGKDHPINLCSKNSRRTSLLKPGRLPNKEKMLYSNFIFTGELVYWSSSFKHIFQLNCKYLGSRVENDIANALTMTPQLVKLGVTMEFRDSLNRTAVQLQKNLDKRKLDLTDISKQLL